MKLISVLVMGSVVLLAGCASSVNGEQTASKADRETYISLGSNIPKKKSSQSESRNVDLQQLENERTTNSATINLPQR
ncbi:hypothetical protein [Janthinobacterium aquaticum]|uniref:hypothetical protein n=1 Tax=Janthinobacterium sp. FT58W TaxID=2654254 RepID=UPI00126561A0|nr:hypothetical protein [Janthinobacterium sp. FT58W]KAB8042246.1 hypothetical protein GCM43_14325 [Janthinobacterium sp. FT58W]